MTFRPIMTILVLCPGVGCSAAGTADDPPHVVEYSDDDGAAAPTETARPAPASAPSLQPGPAAVPSMSGEAGACAALASRATSLSEPIDFILVLDNSASMEDELRAAEQSLNGSFGQLLADSGADYRVILISEHRESDDQDSAVCIQSPLSAVATCPSPEPGASTRFFHYSTEVEGEDSLDVLLESFSGELEDDFGLANLGWSEWLRPGARKVFLVLTAEDADMPAMEFAAALTELAPEQFGQNPSQFNFTWHSIVGLAAPEQATAQPGQALQAYLPEAPIEEGECEGSVSNAGETYQELSRLTGGLRYPVCQMDAYDVMFQQIVEDLVLSSPPCDFTLPGAAPGRVLELGEATLSYQGLSAAPQLLRRTESASSCAADGFFLAGDVARLCPQTCGAVPADASQLQLRFSCGGSAP